MTVVQTPQAAIAAERAILGAMLMDPEALRAALRLLTAPCFHYNAHRLAFQAMGRIHERGEGVGLVSLACELAGRDETEITGGLGAPAGWLEDACAAANVPALARIVREAFVVRERVRVGLEMANGAATDGAHTAALLEQLRAVEAAVAGPDAAPQRWAELSMRGDVLLETGFEPVPSWIGNGILPAGELAFLTGHSGVGKTFLIVQLMSALSIGHSFNGIPTRACRVGLVELEMPWISVQQRVKSLHSGDFTAMAFLCSPPGALHLTDPAARENLAAFVRLHGLDVLILDPFNRLHDADENSGSDMGHVLEGLHELRRTTSVAILCLHHVRKQPSGAPAGPASRASALDAGRGSSRLTNDPATVMALDESKGFVRLTFAKVRHAESPPPIYLKRNAHGFFDVADDPSLAKTKRQDGLRQMLDKSGGEGVTVATAAEIFKVTPKTIERDLKELGAVAIATGRNTRVWVHGDAPEGSLRL